MDGRVVIMEGHAHIHIIALQVSLLQVAYLLHCLFQPIIMNPESSTEQSVKALQAQNAQFQELIMSLAQGQQDLKTLLLKKKKKRTVTYKD